MTHYLVLGAFLVGLAGGWQVQTWRHGYLESQRQEQAREDRARREKTIDVAAAGHEADKREIRTEFITITQEVERVVQTPFYAAGQQCLDDDGMRQLAAALGPATAASQPARAVPGSRPADRR
jgi:protein-disulfide isomerase-like protein with CxxC motif